MLHTNINQMLADERGVSPVIGVILMVAVTVVLAALIGAFVFGLGDDLGASAPNAQVDFSFQASDETLTITHDGGQSITGENTGALFISGDDDEVDNDDFNWGSNLDGSDERATAGDDVSIAAGQNILTIEETNDGVEGADSLQLQWESPNGDQTATLGGWTRP